MLVLLAIGTVHALLIWDGDILMLYALLGLLLPLFYKWSERHLLIAAALLIFVVPFVGIWLFERLGWAPHRYLYESADAIVWKLGIDPSPDKVLDWLLRDDLRGWVAWQGTGTIYSVATRIETWRIAKVLGIMLIGLVVGRRLVSGQIIENRRLLVGVLWTGLAIGVPATFAYAWNPGMGQASWPSLIGTVPLALAYAAAFVLVWPRAPGVAASGSGWTHGADQLPDPFADRTDAVLWHRFRSGRGVQAGAVLRHSGADLCRADGVFPLVA